jgi:sugar phosphate isomerase/epimerase
LHAELEWIAANGFAFVDLNLEPDRADVSAIEPSAVARRLKELQLPAVGHLAWYLPIGSPMKQMRDAAVAASVEYLECFARIGVTQVTVHAHWPSRLFTLEEGLAWQIESIGRIAERAGALGIRMVYEPVCGWQDTADSAQRLLDALPRVALHLDIGHANIVGRSAAATVRRLASRLAHVHAHDNDGREDLHLPPGTGNIDWPEVIAALKAGGYDGTITVEVFSPDRNYLLLARDTLRRLWYGQ